VRILFAGTPEFSIPALEALFGAGFEIPAVYTQPDRPAGRGRKMTPSAVKQRAEAMGLAVQQPVSFKDPETLERLASYSADLMVVVAFGLILPQTVLDTPRLGCLNIHASLLPRWRGAAPIQRAILAGDRHSGVTIMQMDAGLDTGPTLMSRRLVICHDETAGSLHDRLAELGADAIVAAIDDWTSGRIEPRPQPQEGASYAAKIRKSEALIDWAQPAEQIDRQIRAFNPWPVAETRWQGRQLRIWRAVPVELTRHLASGTVVEASGGRIVVAAGTGALELQRLQLPGGRVLSAAELLSAHALAGARLG
jgi:methionyl-tRNA formyltransferase